MREQTKRPALVVVTSWTATSPATHLLGDLERVHAGTLPSWRRRHWTAARLTARLGMHLVHGRVLDDLEILSAADGAPRILGEAAGLWWISLTHRGDWVACAVSPRSEPVGVDIELDGSCDARLLARVSAPGETPSAPYSPTSCWARKEAAFKACRGVPATLSGYQVCPDGSIATAVPSATGRIQLISWDFALPGAVLAVAGQSGPRPQVRLMSGSAVLDFLDRTRQGRLCGDGAGR